jgi:hypothetical protein
MLNQRVIETPENFGGRLYERAISLGFRREDAQGLGCLHQVGEGISLHLPRGLASLS